MFCTKLMVRLGSCFSTAVEHMPCYREDVGLNPAGLFSSLLYPISSASLIRSLAEVQHYGFSYKKCLAMQLEAMQA